ncbi:hypothetical protein OAO87_04440 [bacterium]|nr:hypothetical protein [bacterium]
MSALQTRMAVATADLAFQSRTQRADASDANGVCLDAPDEPSRPG